MKKNGFTILELLLAIVIMSMLTVMTVRILSSLRMSNRDNRRITDVKEIQSALELYYRDNSTYPPSLPAGQPLASSSVTYISNVPENPKPVNDGICPIDSFYDYSSDENGISYHLKFCLGARVSSVGAGINYAIPGDILTCVPDCYLSCKVSPNNGSDGCGSICANALDACPTGFTCQSNHCIVD